MLCLTPRCQRGMRSVLQKVALINLTKDMNMNHERERERERRRVLAHAHTSFCCMQPCFLLLSMPHVHKNMCMHRILTKYFICIRLGMFAEDVLPKRRKQLKKQRQDLKRCGLDKRFLYIFVFSNINEFLLRVPWLCCGTSSRPTFCRN